MEKLYYTAKEVAEMLDVSVSHAYKVIREANRELSSKGFYVRAGRVSRKYLDSKVYDLELLSSKESELIERTKIAESVYDMFRQSGTDDVREKLIDVMYEDQKLREENTTLKELLEKAYEFMKQFVIDGVNLLERFLESVGKMVGKNKNK